MTYDVSSYRANGTLLLIDFWNDCDVMLAPVWNPAWDHVGDFFDQNGAPQIDATFIFVALAFSIVFSLIYMEIATFPIAPEARPRGAAARRGGRPAGAPPPPPHHPPSKTNPAQPQLEGASLF